MACVCERVFIYDPKKTYNKINILGLLFTAPFFVFAQTVTSVIEKMTEILVSIVPGLITLALIAFIWGVIKFITAAGDEQKRKDAKNVIIYGVIGLFAIVAVWGLVEIIAATFEVGIGGTISIPEFN